MNHRVWILLVVLGLSTVFTVRGAFSQGDMKSKHRSFSLGPFRCLIAVTQ